MVFFVLWHVTNDAEESAKQTIQNYMQLMSSKLTDEFYTSIREVEIYAQVEQVKSMEPANFIPFLKKEFLRQNGRYEKLLVSDIDGHLYNTACGNPALNYKCSFDDNDPNSSPKLLTGRQYWQETVGNNVSKTQVTYLSDPIISYTTGVSQLIIASTVFDDNNQLKGMIGASIEWARISKLITDLSQKIFSQYSWQPKIMLISDSGTYWYHWDKNKLVHLKKDAQGNVIKDEKGLPISKAYSINNEPETALHLAHRDMLQKKSGITEFELAETGDIQYLFYQPIESSQYSIALMVSEKDVNQVSYDLKSLYVVVFMIALCVFMFAAIWIAKAITDPIGRLMGQANRLKEGNYAIESKQSGSGELSELSETFAQMATVILDRQKRLEISEERFELAMKGANDGLWDWNLLNNDVYYSPRWKNMLGYGEDELDSESGTYFRLLNKGDYKYLKKEIKAVRLSDKDAFSYKIRMRHKAGHLVHILTRGVVVRDEKGIAKRFVGTHVDITEQTLNQEKIQKLNEDLEKTVRERTLKLEVANRHLNELAMLDMMLNIGNRRGLERHLNLTHTRFKEEGQNYAVLLFDVDYFKRYNDLFGHQEGDNVLINVVNCLKDNLNKSEKIYRYGGEEFICVLPESSLNKAITLAQKMVLSIENLQIKHAKSHYGVVTVSVGCAEVRADDMSWEQLISRSDKALYVAKAKGRNQISADSSPYESMFNS
ncbi:GGDEF family protein [Marinomonas sp. MED121]|nr:GGDEF family protein [Marinomonas sp. MED121]